MPVLDHVERVLKIVSEIPGDVHAFVLIVVGSILACSHYPNAVTTGSSLITSGCLIYKGKQQS